MHISHLTVVFGKGDTAGYTGSVDPFALAEGFDVVIVNGHIARENATLQPARYGRVPRAGRR